MPMAHFVAVLSAAYIEGGGGTPTDPDFANYFRIRYGKAPTGVNVSYSEIALNSGGVDQASGGTILFSSEANGTTRAAANAFDNSLLTQYSALANTGQWIGYHFSGPEQITEVKMDAGLTGDASTNARHLLFETSSDGVSWTLQSDHYDTGGAMAAGNQRTYPVIKIDYTQNDDSAHRYWRIRPILMGGGASYAGLREVVFLDEAEADITTGGTAMGSTAAGGNPIANAFDKSVGTEWRSNAIDQDMWIGYDFLVPVTPKKVRLTSPGTLINVPYGFVVEFSDNASDWFPVTLFIDVAWSTTIQSMTFVLSRLTPIVFVSKLSRYILTKRVGPTISKLSRYIIFKP